MRAILFQVFAAVPVREFLPSNSIVGDYLRGDPAAVGFFSPLKGEVLCEAVIGARRPQRREVVEALLGFNRSLGAPPKALENGRRLRDEDALVVMTGQQPGVLTGPLYTVYKALTAVQLARRFGEELGRPVVPVFWAATEDHDFREVSAVSVPDSEGKPLRIELPGEMGHGGGPVGAIPLDQNVRLFLNRFLDTLPEGGFREEVECCLRGAMERSPTLGGWFSRLMSSLMGEQGLVILDPLDAALKRLSAPVFERVLEGPLAVTEMVNRAGDRLEEAGYRRQIHKAEDLCPFFIINEGVRENVRFQGETFHCASHAFSRRELRELLETEPQRLSPNAALRPIVSDHLLPVMAYVAGPGEIGYYAQLREVYQHFGLPMPRVLLRKSLTLVEPRTRRLLEKLGVEPGELRDKTGLLESLVRSRHDIVSHSFWDERVDAVSRLLGGIREEVASLDPTLLDALDNTISSVSQRIRKFEARLIKNLRQREELLKEQIEQAGARLFPGGDLQERTMNIFHFLSLYGWELLRLIKDGPPAEDGLHRFVYIA